MFEGTAECRVPSKEPNSFATVITQKGDDPGFVKFKISLKSFEESEKLRKQHNDKCR